MADSPNGPSFPGQVAVHEAPATVTDTGAFLDQLAADAARASLPTDSEYDAPTREVEQPRAENGRFTKVPRPEDATDNAVDAEEAAVQSIIAPDATTAVETDDAASTTATEGTTDGGEGETPASPFAALPTIDAPIIPITVKIGDTVLEKVPAMEVTLTVNGKERTFPLDKLARVAADGVYSEAREQKYRAIESEALTVKQQLAAYEQAMDDAQAYVDELLSDEVKYLSESDAFRAQHTPEQRAARLEAELRAERESGQRRQIAEQGERYFTKTLTPALDKIAEALPFVAPEEMVAKLSLYVGQVHGGRGYLLPTEYDRVSNFVVDDLLPWAKEQNATRAERFAPKADVAKVVADAAKEKETAKAEQAKAQQSKSKIASALKPVGKAGPSAPPKKAPPTNVDDAMDDAVNEAVAAVLGR